MRILREATVRASELSLDQLDSSFRKATLNMAMATLSCQQALQGLPEGVAKEQVALIVATHFGEVASTLGFLSTYRETQTPRPILFQNSLHNSTLGFVSIQLGLTGPAMTVSCDHRTREASLEMATTLFELCPYVLLCFVDEIPAPLVSYYVANFPWIEAYLGRACCQLLAKE